MNANNKGYDRINQHIKDFLKFNGYQSTLEALELEENTKVPMPIEHPERLPKLYKILENISMSPSKQLKQATNKHQQILHQARQIF
jgi:hypothetical protein